MAHYFQQKGLTSGAAVAVYIPRSIRYITTILAILKVGSYYVPIDPQNPPERCRFMMQNAGIRWLVTTDRQFYATFATNTQVLDVIQDATQIARQSCLAPAPIGSPNDLAYVMYTSGSTGQPKGVKIPHRAVCSLVFGLRDVLLGPTDRILCLAPTSFDASTFEIWIPLLRGAACVIPPPGSVDLQQLEWALTDNQITCLWLTAALFNMVIERQPQALRTLRWLLVGGEVLSVPQIQQALQALPNTQIINGYGPTETTTFACTYPIPHNLPPETQSIPIGQPLAHTRVYLLDRQQMAVADGVIGELYIGGDGVAQGYSNHPELTAKQFLPDPFVANSKARMYRSGDWGRKLTDGTLEFVGRKDDQLKIRGFRVEPNEIEIALQCHNKVRQAIVVGVDNGTGERILVAYIVSVENQLAATRDQLRQHLHTLLPAYMCPLQYLFLTELPLTANGKVDRKSLPKPTHPPTTTPTKNRPLTKTEQRLAALWCRILGCTTVSWYDDFFSLGGNSLKAVLLVDEISKQLGRQLRVADVFAAPTLKALAMRLDPATSPAYKKGRYLEWLREGTDLPYAITLGMPYQVLWPNLWPSTPILWGQTYPLQDRFFRRLSIEAQVEKYLQRFTRQFANRPVVIFGYSHGALLAYELTQRLRQRKILHVKTLLLEPSLPPNLLTTIATNTKNRDVPIREQLTQRLLRNIQALKTGNLAYTKAYISRHFQKYTKGTKQRITTRIRMQLGLPVTNSAEWSYHCPAILAQIAAIILSHCQEK